MQAAQVDSAWISGRWARRLTASAAILGTAAALFAFETRLSLLESGPPLLMLLAAAILIHRDSLLPQAAARLLCWVILFPIALGCMLGNASGPLRFVPTLLAVALLMLGRIGLDRARRGSFVPLAYEGWLFNMIVLSGLNALISAWVVVSMLGYERSQQALPWMALALVSAAASFGLFRLRLWGLILYFLAAAVPAASMAPRIFDRDRDLFYLSAFEAEVLVAVFCFELLFLLPVAVGLIRRRPLQPAEPHDPRTPRVGWIFSQIAAIALAVGAWAVHNGP